MNFTVTSFAESYSVADFISKFWKLRPLFYMVGVKVSIRAALLTLVSVACKNLFAPLAYLRLDFLTFRFGLAALPAWMLGADYQPSGTRPRTIDSAFVSAHKSLLTVGALFSYWRISMRPAFPRTIFGYSRPVEFHGIRVSADRASVCYASV